jgi:hypothetical protein
VAKIGSTSIETSPSPPRVRSQTERRTSQAVATSRIAGVEDALGIAAAAGGELCVD